MPQPLTHNLPLPLEAIALTFGYVWFVAMIDQANILANPKNLASIWSETNNWSTSKFFDMPSYIEQEEEGIVVAINLLAPFWLGRLHEGSSEF